MTTPLYAMDTSFFSSIGVYEFDARCEMLRELGYDATYLTLWNEAAWADVAQLPTVRERFGLDVAAVYVILDPALGPDDPASRRIAELVETLEGCRTIEVSIRSSDPALAPSDRAGDEAARRSLTPLLERAERRGITIALYPHIRFWLERIEDAVRLCRMIDHPRLGAVFCGYHWFAADGQRLGERIAEAAPYLTLANLCGSRRFDNGSGMPATIEPLDEGELDNFALLGMLKGAGFDGPIGVQGFAVGGDVYARLRRSLAAFRDMERRLAEHPEWARLRPPRSAAT